MMEYSVVKTADGHTVPVIVREKKNGVPFVEADGPNRAQRRKGNALLAKEFKRREKALKEAGLAQR